MLRFLSLLSLFVLMLAVAQSQSVAENNAEPMASDSLFHYKNFIKVNLFPMIGGRLNIAWEGGSVKKSAFEVGLEGIGLFAKGSELPKGFAGQLGYRFYTQFIEATQHPNSGFFIMPAFKMAYTQYFEYLTVYDGVGNKTVFKNQVNSSYFIPNINIGKQFVLHKRFSLELMAGIGYLLQSGDNSNPLVSRTYTPVQDPLKYGFFQWSNTLPIVGSATVRLGYLFN